MHMGHLRNQASKIETLQRVAQRLFLPIQGPEFSSAPITEWKQLSFTTDSGPLPRWSCLKGIKQALVAYPLQVIVISQMAGAVLSNSDYAVISRIGEGMSGNMQAEREPASEFLLVNFYV